MEQTVSVYENPPKPGPVSPIRHPYSVVPHADVELESTGRVRQKSTY